MTLIVKDANSWDFQNGVKETITELRRKQWVIKTGRSHIRSIIHQHIICKQYEGASYTGPPVPSLPHYRVTQTPAFTITPVLILQA